MPYHAEIAAEARQAYVESRYSEALLLYRRAASLALVVADRSAWYGYSVRAADVLFIKRDLHAALASILEARQLEPRDAPLGEAWWLRQLMFDVTQALHPVCSRLGQILADLRAYGAERSLSMSDVSLLEGQLLFAQGNWRAGLAQIEISWRDHIEGEGCWRTFKAYIAADCCLRLGDFTSCREWTAALDQCDRGAVETRSRSAALTLWLAVAEAQSVPVLLRYLRTYLDRERGPGVREAMSRVHLLDSSAGDPAADVHPTYGELRHPLEARQDVHSRYAAHLLHLDYRLACLRYAAGVPAVDDLYYRWPQQVPTDPIAVADLSQLRHRLHKASIAARCVLRYARRLDMLLECDYRQNEVRARWARIAEIALVCLGDRLEIS